jgi:hypothetical protein
MHVEKDETQTICTYSFNMIVSKQTDRSKVDVEIHG